MSNQTFFLKNYYNNHRLLKNFNFKFSKILKNYINQYKCLKYLYLALTNYIYIFFFLQRTQFFYVNPLNYLITLNFKRLRFFPSFKNTQDINFTSLSLGLLAKFFRKGKFFLKSKVVYLALTNFFRKLLLFSGIKLFFLQINRNPRYFLEIMSTLLDPVINIYNNPFNLQYKINESNLNHSFIFHSILFTSSKPYGKVKTKQRGRLKRKIQSRVIKLNKVLD